MINIDFKTDEVKGDVLIIKDTKSKSKWEIYLNNPKDTWNKEAIDKFLVEFVANHSSDNKNVELVVAEETLEASKDNTSVSLIIELFKKFIERFKSL
ncbi:hypothetical protein KQ874_01975 [Mycoplasma sp. ES3157-GEN-MYC]|uniref:Uncharacterized protein n=1 Tax=Mycoplasma miroungigenitalium TaxID=754515 RepID=A0A6M4JFS8_9MOLU|nr:hypothetical protein [Mycoplasma miroungigenitalium]MBU4690456.1 hypothetical protein [Mycoplasma miroungigenitalium]MBU4691723.1 hypothetical protein [Mycoplasma miroungigenitalium]QJR43551.1 hypothetical protein HLA87_01980 [Mycoplasma miroungigenitalium]